MSGTDEAETADTPLPWSARQLAELIADKLGANYYCPQGEQADVVVDDGSDSGTPVVWASAPGCPQRFAIAVIPYEPADEASPYEVFASVVPVGP